MKRSSTGAGAKPLQQSSTNLPSSTRARRAGRRSRRARRARASAGSASRAELGKAKIVLSRVLAEYGKTKHVSLIPLVYYIYVSLFTVSILVCHKASTHGGGVAGAAPLQQSSTNLPSSTRARRAGRRSRRARRARASAGSASRAELEKAKVGVNATR